VVGYREQPGIAAAPAVATDLPAPQPPSPAVNVSAPPSDSPPTEDGTPAVFIDPQTNTIVYQVLDTNTGDVIEQVPAPPLLRQLAYDRAQAVQALIDGNNLNTAMQKIDTTS
jgi:flagellar protein FlaG